MRKLRVIFLMFGLFSINVADKPCIPRVFYSTSIVCVCNSTYCDEIEKINTLPSGQFIVYQSTEAGQRFYKQRGTLEKKYSYSKTNDFVTFMDYFNNGRLGEVVLNIKRNKRYQKIYGFGGSVTDAVGENAMRLSPSARKNLLNSFFGVNGLEYNMVRMPIGSSDFSSRFYCYNMEPENDTLLSNFTLAPEDFKYKIPVIKYINKIATDDVYIMASSWAPPKWMKTTNKKYINVIKKEYYQLFVDYHIRYLEEMRKQGIEYWAITPGNEPSIGIQQYISDSVGWYNEDYIKWIKENFGPTLRKSKFSNLLFFIIDDARSYLPWMIEFFANDKEASKYVDGISFHIYADEIFPPTLVDDVHKLFPNAIILSTEACIGTTPYFVMNEIVELGSWERGIIYFTNIIENLKHWYAGWIDWNLCLDLNGGPNFANNNKDASVILPLENDEFYKQPMFYAMGHFSKFVPRGSVRIHVDTIVGNIENIAFLRPDGGIAVIFHNPDHNKRTVTVEESGKGMLKVNVLPRSFVSLVYW